MHGSYSANDQYNYMANNNMGTYGPTDMGYYDPSQDQYYNQEQIYMDDVNPFSIQDCEMNILYKDESRSELKACTVEKLIEKLTTVQQFIGMHTGLVSDYADFFR